jgi:hypothetical protein
VPFELAPLACAMSVVVTHALGDAISPSILGSILDGTGDDWHLTMFLNVAWSCWAIIFWGAGWRYDHITSTQHTCYWLLTRCLCGMNRWASLAARQSQNTIVTLPKSPIAPSTIRDPLLQGETIASESFDYLPTAAPLPVHAGISVNGRSAQ